MVKYLLVLAESFNFQLDPNLLWTTEACLGPCQTYDGAFLQQ